MKDQFRASFYGFVKGLSLRGSATAKRVVGYGGAGHYTKSAMVDKITAARSRGNIEADWFETLMDSIDALWERWNASSQILDVRDPRDWEQVSGGHRRKDHKARDEADYEARQLMREM
jgi:hypothetical protein